MVVEIYMHVSETHSLFLEIVLEKIAFLSFGSMIHINDSYQSFVLDSHDVSKNAIVIAIFNCLMMNSLCVCNVKLDKGFAIEQLLIEDDLRR